MATILVFASSLSIATLILLAKAFEIKFQKRNALLGFICRLDQKAINLVETLKFKTLQIIQSVRYILLVESKIFFQSVVIGFLEKIVSEYKTRENTIMGYRNISNKGSVSFFLKKIDESKKSGQRGEIL